MNNNQLKVLMVASDRTAFSPESAVTDRLKEYGTLVGELHVVIFSDLKHGLREMQIGNNIWIYPTNSQNKFLRPLDAVRIGRRLIFDKEFVRGKSLITAQDPFECGWAGLQLKKKWRIPLELQMHTDPFSPYFKGTQNMMRKILMRNILKNADSVRVVSESLKPFVSKLTSASIKVLPIYVEKEKIKSSQPSVNLHKQYPWRFIILAVARLAPEKNIGVAIEALKIVSEKFSDVGLVIVGSGPEEGRLKDMSKKLGLEGVVVFAGWQNDLASFYKTADLFIQTSLFEGYGLSLVEAGLSDLPIVTTQVGLARELEHDRDVYICKFSNPHLFALGIMRLMENNEKRESLKINMKSTLESKLISKEDYLSKLKSNWEGTALRAN